VPWREPAAALGLLAATFWAYLPSLPGGILWDDPSHLTAPRLQGWSGLVRIWTQLGATQQYYPVLHTAFWFEHRLWGDVLWPYHLLNVALHAACAVLFALALRRIVPAPSGAARFWPAWFAAAVFALHPVAVESVAWISEQKNTLSLFFYLLAALTYLRFERSRARGAYALASLLFVLAVLTKSVTATLPAALLLVGAWRRARPPRWGEIAPLVPWLLFGLAAGAVTAVVEAQYVGAHGHAYELSPVARLFLAGRAIWFYLGKLFWPSPLAFIYARWQVQVTLAWSCGLVAAIGALGLLWGVRRLSPAPLVAFLFFVGSLFPALGFLNVYPFIFSYVADHWQYLPCLGVIALVAGGGGGLVQRGLGRLPAPGRGLARLGAAGLAAALLVVLAVLTRRQSALYRDAGTLYADTLAKNPDCWMADNNLGLYLAAGGHRAEAIAHYRAALRLKPDYADAHNNLGNALSAEGRDAEARAEFEAAVRWQPGMVEAEGNLGWALAKTPGRLAEGIAHLENSVAGHRDDPAFAALFGFLGLAAARDPARQNEAVEAFTTALRLNPGLVELRDSLGVLLARAGRTAQAQQEFERAIADRPSYAEAHDNLGNILVQQGHEAQAEAEFRRAIALAPAAPAPHFNLGRALRDQGDGGAALDEYREALRLGGDFAELRSSMGSVLYRQGHIEEAIDQYGRAVQLEPGSARDHNNLGIALLAAGRLDRAEAELREALRLAPDFAAAHYGLGLALRREGRSAEAASEFNLARRPAGGP